MIEVPKLVLVLLIGFLVWYAMRWFNGGSSRSLPRGTRPRRQAPPRQPQIEDLVACRKCGAYVALSAHACGRAGCPRPE
jgi:hypothetical protein